MRCWCSLRRLCAAQASSHSLSLAVRLGPLRLAARLVLGGKPVPAGDNPWDGHTLEWFATSPPVHHNFERLPPVRSERPVWDFHHPDAVTIGHGSGNGHGRIAESVGAETSPGGPTE